MIPLIQGNSADFSLAVTVDDEPLDVSNHKIWFTIKDNKSEADSVADLQVTTEGGGIVITDGPAGEVLISLTPEETQSLPLNLTLHCDVQIRTPEGKVYTILFDDITVTERVTKDLDM